MILFLNVYGFCKLVPALTFMHYKS